MPIHDNRLAYEFVHRKLSSACLADEGIVCIVPIIALLSLSALSLPCLAASSEKMDDAQLDDMYDDDVRRHF